MPDLQHQASVLDQGDALQPYRQQFHLPTAPNGRKLIYFCGNSLGLQPKNATRYLQQSLDKWKQQAVEGHFQPPDPWVNYHTLLKKPLAHICGALPHEVVAMNNLTTNLHLMMASFYRPTARRYKILIEGGAFPSDQYAVESQVGFHGYNPEEAIVELIPRGEEHTLGSGDILDTIRTQGEQLALVLLPGVQYYSGQLFDMRAVTQVAHEVGARVGFDLAHAVGNVPLHLHDWNVDFAVWCTYKYLNAGPGNNGGAFVHERHASDPGLPRLAGWWGHSEEERFRMKKGFKPMYGADGWQLSNVNILSTAVQRAALEITVEAGMDKLRAKSMKLTAFLEECILSLDPEGERIKIITPATPEARGCQLSMLSARYGKKLFEKLTDAGIVVDWREPDVIRVAPAPLYNTFGEVYRFYEILKNTLDES